MDTGKQSRKIIVEQLILLLIAFVLMGCGKSEPIFNEPRSTDVATADSGVNETGAGESSINESGIELEILTYTNQEYGFEFEYPATWNLTEEGQGVVLKKGPNRLGILFNWAGQLLPNRTGIPAGDLIYEGKIRFLGQVLPAEFLTFEKKYKAVFYGGTGFIEADDLEFSIALEDLDTGSYQQIDLSDELIAEANEIVASFKRIDWAESSTQGPSTSETGLVAYLELPEQLPVGENVNLKFVLKNVSATPLYVLNWYTPLEGIGGEIFKVTHDGQPISYQGILASRGLPTADAYTLLNPGESVSAVVDLAGSFDFSKVGKYRIKFISPRISHIARTEADMAKTMEELGPVDIPSNDVAIELVESMRGEGYPRLRTTAEAQEMIEAYLREQELDLGIEPILPVEELHVEQLWSALQAQVFKVREWKFQNESFLIWGSRVIQLGTALGGQGLTSLVVADIDQNYSAELIYAYSSGSDVQLSRIGMFSTAYQGGVIFESDVGYFGQLGVFSEDWSHVGVHVIEGDQDTKELQDPLGFLFIEQNDRNVMLGLKMYMIPPEDVLEKLFSTKDSSQN